MTLASHTLQASQGAVRSPLRVALRSYLALFVRSVRANFAYRQSLLPSMLAAALSYAVPVLVWRHVYALNPQSHAVPSAAMFPYLLLAGCLNYALGIGVEARVGQRIRTGMIATDLLKPVDFQLAQASQAMSDGLFNSFLCVPIAAVAYAVLGSSVLPANFWAFCGFVVSAVLAFAIMFSISFLFVQAAFFTYSGYGIFAARSALQQTFSGLSAPLLMFPVWLRATSEWLPFRHTIHSPLSIYLGWTSGARILSVLLQQALWATVLFAIGRWTLARSLRRLEIQGG
ncbi:MAG TPA: ABC-2 family transporter protein [Polyangiaceae bacterium]|nr:ABC-2 family transporter protein [Polyangiaceae bacterium]